MLRKLTERDFDGVEEKPVNELFEDVTVENGLEFELAEKLAGKTILGFLSEKKGKLRHRVLCIDGNLEKKSFRLNNKQFTSLQREVEHIDQRVKDGVSYRDAWNVDHWIPRTCSKILAHLAKNTHGFPPCAVELHKRVVGEVDGKKYRREKKYAGMNSDDHAWNVYLDDLKRMVFLFSESDEETCSKKNPYEFRLHWNFLDDPEHGDCRVLKFEGTEDEKAETEKYRQVEAELCKYRAECLHKAMKMLDIYIEYLWD